MTPSPLLVSQFYSSAKPATQPKLDEKLAPSSTLAINGLVLAKASAICDGSNAFSLTSRTYYFVAFTAFFVW